MSDVRYIFELKRFRFLSDVTNGKLYLPDGTYFSDVLEDTDRDSDQNGEVENKVWGQTAIPYGIYPMVFGDSPAMKKRLIGIQNVNGFQGIWIHSGNTPLDTKGCLLLGRLHSPHFIANSRDTVKQFEEVVAKYQADGSETYLQITKDV